jgi:hypothetical protein
MSLLHFLEHLLVLFDVFVSDFKAFLLLKNCFNSLVSAWERLFDLLSINFHSLILKLISFHKLISLLQEYIPLTPLNISNYHLVLLSFTWRYHSLRLHANVPSAVFEIQASKLILLYD